MGESAKATNKNSHRRISILDKDTGEVIDSEGLIYSPKKIRIKERWFMAMQDGFTELAKTPLRGESMRVLLFMLGQMQFENSIPNTQQEISEFLSLKRQNVHRAIKELKDKHIISDGPHKTFQLDTAFAWKGKVTNLRKKQAVDMQNEMRKDHTALH